MPRPPPPPPPPPPPGARSRASLTVSGRPPNGLPLRALTAAWAWASVASSTKAKPRGRPVSRSVTIFTSSTWRPSCSNRARSCASSHWYGRLPTYSLFPILTPVLTRTPRTTPRRSRVFRGLVARARRHRPGWGGGPPRLEEDVPPHPEALADQLLNGRPHLRHMTRHGVRGGRPANAQGGAEVNAILDGQGNDERRGEGGDGRPHQPRQPGRVGEQRRLLLGPDHRHRYDRGAGPEGDVHEAVSELEQPIALPEGPAERLHALRAGEHGAAGAEQVRARVAASVHGPDAPRGPADDRQLHQAVLGHAVHEPRRVGVEEARGQDHGAVPGERVRAVVGDQHDGTARQGGDPVALDAEVAPVHQAGHQEETGRRLEAKPEALGRRVLEGAGGGQAGAHHPLEAHEAPEAGQAMPPSSWVRRGERARRPLRAPTRLQRRLPAESHWITIASRA